MKAISRSMDMIYGFMMISVLLCLFNALELSTGGRYQSAELSDTSPAAITMRISNGFIGAYGNLNLVW